MLAMEAAATAAAKAVAGVKWCKEQTKPLARLLDPSLLNNNKLAGAFAAAFATQTVVVAISVISSRLQYKF